MKVGQGEDIEVWEAGLYPATVQDIVETVSTFPGNEGKPQLRFVYRVWGGGEHGLEPHVDIWDFTGVTLSKHPAAKLRPVLTTLRPDLNLDDAAIALDLGHPEGQKASPDDALVGRKCRVVLGVNEVKGRNTVDKVLTAEAQPRRPSPQRAAPQRQPVAAAVEQEDDAAGF